MNIITPKEARDWFATADDAQIEDFLECGLQELIEELESEDYFGTEGFEKRFA